MKLSILSMEYIHISFLNEKARRPHKSGMILNICVVIRFIVPAMNRKVRGKVLNSWTKNKLQTWLLSSFNFIFKLNKDVKLKHFYGQFQLYDIFTRKEMKEVFDMIDTDGSGNLSMEEVLLYLKSITDDMSEENLEKIFQGIDSSGDQVVDFDEFKVRPFHSFPILTHS